MDLEMEALGPRVRAATLRDAVAAVGLADADFAMVEIQSDGMAANTLVRVDGKPISGVIRAELDIQVDGFATAILTIEGVRVRWRASMTPTAE